MRNEREEKAALLGLTAAAYGKELTRGLLGLYLADLKDLSLEQLGHALQQCRMDPAIRFMPTAGQILEKLEGSLESRAVKAWELLIDNLDPYESVIFADPRLCFAVRALGGWLKVCDMTEDETPYRRAEFMRYYQAADGAQSVKHIGLIERQNAARGFDVPPPVVLGEGAPKMLEEHSVGADMSGEVIETLRKGLKG